MGQGHDSGGAVCAKAPNSRPRKVMLRKAGVKLFVVFEFSLKNMLVARGHVNSNFTSADVEKIFGAQGGAGVVGKMKTPHK
jgi:hypothetical protein